MPKTRVMLSQIGICCFLKTECYNELYPNTAYPFFYSMFQRLQVQLTILFAAFVLLVIVSAGVTYWGLQTQRRDALVINLAGRQRMLAEQITRLAFQVRDGDESAGASLQEAEQTFSQTLHALQNGGTAPYLADSEVVLPVTRDPEVRAALDEEEAAWGQYRSMLDEMTSTVGAPSSLQASLEAQSDNLMQKADLVVRRYETASTAKLNRLRAIQAIFLACALALLAVGAWITRRSLLKPLQELGFAAKRLGENDLETQVQVEGPIEMRALSHVFDEMRSRLHKAREELIGWNATLEQRVAQRTHELEALNEVSREISSRLEIQQVLNSVTEKARMLLEGKVASLCLVDASQHWLKLQAVSGPQSAVVGETVRADVDFANDVLTGEQAMLCGVGNCQGGCRMLSEKYRASHLAAPLRVGNRVIGALCVGSPVRNRFTTESADMLTKLANVAAIALENARLFAQAERVATLEERRRIAAEMHDGLAQTLSYLGLMTDQAGSFLADGQNRGALEKLEQARLAIRDATIQVRQAIDQLMDESPLRHGLAEHIQTLVLDFGRKHDLNVEWRNLMDGEVLYSRQVLEQILHITREALKNAASHAEAGHVMVRMNQLDDHYYISVEDDGKGFDVLQPEPNGHFGLKVMQARASHIGGKIGIESTKGIGTMVTLKWPVKESEQDETSPRFAG